MKNVLIQNARIILPDQILEKGCLRICDGIISEISERLLTSQGNEKVFDATENFCAPGLVDTLLHVDGDCSIQNVLNEHLSEGTTSFIAALSTAPEKKLFSKIHDVLSVAKSSEDEIIFGIHCEGPFINSNKAGAQNKDAISSVDENYIKELIQTCEGFLLGMTLAPELESVQRLIEILSEHKVKVSFGHSEASYDQSMKGFQMGVDHVTHLFNQMTLIHHREPGLAIAALMNDQVSVSIIADMFHVHPEMIQLILKLKPKNKIILISDCVTSIHGKNQSPPRINEQTIAGSRISLFQSVSNIVRKCHVKKEDAILMGSTNPAKMFGIYPKKGIIQKGSDGDLVIFDSNFKVIKVIKNGILL